MVRYLFFSFISLYDKLPANTQSDKGDVMVVIVW